MSSERWVEEVRAWLRDRIVGLGLCPYASGPVHGGRVRIAVEPGDLEARLTALVLEAERLLATDLAECETTLLLVPSGPTDFEDFLDETDLGLELLEQVAGEELQAVAFHPSFRFADSDRDDPANAVNRSPMPLWHLLRERSVERVLRSDPDAVAAVPGRNRDLLRALALDTAEG